MKNKNFWYTINNTYKNITDECMKYRLVRNVR